MYGKRSSWPLIMELLSNSIWWMYTAVGNPLQKAGRVVILTNNTDVDLYFSIKPSPKAGAQPDMLKVVSYSSASWDITTQKAMDDDPLLLPVGTQFYVRSKPFACPSQDLWVAISVLIVESGS